MATGNHTEEKKLRLDKWLWAVRVFKTRSIATAACKGGHVKYAGNRLKPSHCVAIGETYEIERNGHCLTYEVLGLLEKRPSAKEAALYFKDHTPPAPPKSETIETAYPLLKRPRGSGRPTKKERRELDSFFG